MLRHVRAILGCALDFLRGKVPWNWGSFRDSVTGNLRVIGPRDFRVAT
ncbi:MAG: hypothetical protein ACR2KT_08520 [Methylocella sp.]